MADNYLEKKMEMHAARAKAGKVTGVKGNLLSLLEKSSPCVAFSDYAVRDDQLRRLVSAAAKVTPAFLYRLLVGVDAVAFRAASGALPATAYMVVCASSSPCDEFLLGRVAQTVFLQAAEIGLSAVVVDGVNPSLVAEKLSLQALPLLVVAVGRNAEPALPLDAVSLVDNLII